MKKKIFSVLLALVLVLSFSLVTAVPTGAATTFTREGSTISVVSVHLCDQGAETEDAFNDEPETLVLDGVAFDAQSCSQVVIEGEVSGLNLGAGWVDTAYIEIGLRPEATKTERNAGVYLIAYNAYEGAGTEVHLQDYSGMGYALGVITLPDINTGFRYKITLNPSGEIGGTATLEVWVGEVSQGIVSGFAYGCASTWEEGVAGALDEDFSSAHLFYSIIADRRGTDGQTYNATVGNITIDDTLYVGAEQQFTTIQEAVNFANPGDTINVAVGEYAGAIVDRDVKIIGAVGGTSVITNGVIYKAGGPSYYTGFRLDDGADGAEIRNFTMNGDFWFGVFARNANSVIVDSLALNDMVQGITNWGGSNWEITNNVITETYPTTGGGIAIYLGADPTTFPHCDNNLVQYNTITTNRAQSSTFTGAAICLWFDMRGCSLEDLDGESVTGNQIKDNPITASGLENQTGIEIGVGGLGGDPIKVAACLGVIHDNTVTNNTIDNAEWGLYIYVTTDLTVSGNTIKNCSDCGIYMKDDHANCLINYNDIYGNTNYGLNNTDGATYERTVDALYNWWDDVTGPEHATLNPGAQGDAVSNNVLFSPWLYKTQEEFIPGEPCYAGSVVLENEATLVNKASYAGGWNTFSTPILLDSDADTVVELLDLVEGGGLFIVRAQCFDPVDGWVFLATPDGVIEAYRDYQIKPGEGFFIQVSTKGSLPILCSMKLEPPQSWELSLGWNLVGAPSYVSKAAEDAFSSLGATCTVVNSPGANPASWSYPPAAGNKVLLPGRAYWVAMSADGTLMCFDGTQVADYMTWDLNH